MGSSKAADQRTGEKLLHTISLSLSCNSFSLFLFSSFFTDRGLVRLLPLLSQEFLAHSRLFVRPSFDLLTGRTILFYFFSPLLGEDGLIFEGTIAERVTFLFSLFFLLFRHLFVQSKIRGSRLEYDTTINRMVRNSLIFARSFCVTLVEWCRLIFFFSFCWSCMRGVQIYIYMVCSFFLSIVEGGLSERVVSGWGGGRG